MRAVLIDTAGPTARLALVTDTEVIDVEWAASRTLSQELLTHLATLLGENSLTLADIDRIGVRPGPGHFGSLRQGVLVATLLAYAQGIPLVSIDATTPTTQREQLIAGSPVDHIEPVYT